MSSVVRRPRPRLALGAVGVVAAFLLTGCSLPDGAAPVPSSPSASEGGASGTPAPAPEVSTHTLTADGIEMLLTVPLTGTDEGNDSGGATDAPVTVTPDEDGSSRVAFVLPVPAGATGSGSPTAGTTTPGATTDHATGSGTTGSSSTAEAAVPATIDLVSPADGSLVRNSDGSLSVLDAAGTPLGGFSAPEATEASGSAARAGVVVVAPTRAEVHVRAEAAAPSGSPVDAQQGVTVTTWLGAQGVRSATWGEREGGRSLAVDPTPWARQSGIVGEATAWAQLVASEPEASSTSMRDQFDCHALGATDKKTWNLEPWRPDVGFLATAAARCNPTG